MQTYHRLQTVPGIGKILALVLLYEIHDIRRFADGRQVPVLRPAGALQPRVGRQEAGHRAASKIGNAHLRWAFAEAACLFLRGNAPAKSWLAKQEKKHGKGKALAILAARLGRAVYHLLRKEEPFDAKRFWAS